MSNESFGNRQPVGVPEKRLPEPLQRLFSQLSASDIAQFNSAYQLWMLHQQIDLLYLQIALTRQEIQSNAERLHLTQPTALELSTLAQLQANGVDDIDLLDRLHARGEAWLDHAIQLLAHCERMDLIQGDYTQWCEHALEGAYDWISSIDDDDLSSAENQHEQPTTPAPATIISSPDYDEQAEAMFLRKLFTEAGEEIPEEIEPTLPITLPALSAYETVPAPAPSLDDPTEVLPLKDITAEVLPLDDSTAEVPPLDNSSVVLPLDDSSVVLPLDDSSVVLPPDDSSVVLPPEDITAETLSHDDPIEEEVSPHTDLTVETPSLDNLEEEVSPHTDLTVETPSLDNTTEDISSLDDPTEDTLPHNTIAVDIPSQDRNPSTEPSRDAMANGVHPHRPSPPNTSPVPQTDTTKLDNPLNTNGNDIPLQQPETTQVNTKGDDNILQQAETAPGEEVSSAASTEEAVSIPQEASDKKPIFSDRDTPGPPPLVAEKLLRAQHESERSYVLPMKRTSLVSRVIGFFFPKR